VINGAAVTKDWNGPQTHLQLRLDDNGGARPASRLSIVMISACVSAAAQMGWFPTPYGILWRLHRCLAAAVLFSRQIDSYQ